MRQGFPPAKSGMCVGLLGGSFDPAHEGHAHITREALKRFDLDEVWWLVSPGNPLKTKGPAPLQQRMTRARSVMKHPKVWITDLETRLGTRYTHATLMEIKARYPGVRFVWLMGADNLSSFHKWDNWRQIMEMVPIVVMARPGQRISARLSPAAQVFRRYKLRSRHAQRIKHAIPPAWVFVNVPMSDASSTSIRAQGGWIAG
ncbi:MAG: nicotinate-nucleotide adenylyltransferase [Pseudomonadota bacterium]